MSTLSSFSIRVPYRRQHVGPKLAGMTLPRLSRGSRSTTDKDSARPPAWKETKPCSTAYCIPSIIRRSQQAKISKSRPRPSASASGPFQVKLQVYIGCKAARKTWQELGHAYAESPFADFSPKEEEPAPYAVVIPPPRRRYNYWLV